MRKVGFGIFVSVLANWSSIASAIPLLHDEFDGPNGSRVSSDIWHIPTWVSSEDGTFIGRTQFRVTQNSPLPSIDNGNAIILLETYNPTGDTPGQSFYGTDLISNELFSLERGLHIKVRAKMNASAPSGIVGGIFLYALKSESSTNHDEIDFELITKIPNVIQTNVYSNEPLGAGHSKFTSYETGSIYDYHTYEITWEPTKVSWLIDGKLVRTEADHIPAGPMYFHLNIWAPDSDWKEAYDPSFQHTDDLSKNQKFWMSVDSVEIKRPIEIKRPTFSTISPIIHLLISED